VSLWLLTSIFLHYFNPNSNEFHRIKSIKHYLLILIELTRKYQLILTDSVELELLTGLFYHYFNLNSNKFHRIKSIKHYLLILIELTRKYQILQIISITLIIDDSSAMPKFGSVTWSLKVTPDKSEHDHNTQPIPIKSHHSVEIIKTIKINSIKVIQ